MLPGLQQAGQETISKIDPSSSMNFIFMDEEEVGKWKVLNLSYRKREYELAYTCFS